MYYINTDTATEEHKFTDGNESELIPATDLNAAFFNMIQSELQNVVLGGGLELDPSDDSQVWKVIQKLGIRRFVTSDATVDIGDYKGSLFIIHDVSNFTLSSTVAVNSLVIVIPLWADNSPSSLAFTYNGQSITIRKGQMMIGWALNIPASPIQMAAVALPIFFGGKMELGNVNASSLKTSKFLDAGLISFEFSNDDDPELGMPEWKAWQIAENWEVGQVKRVYCSNVNTVRKVPVFYDANSTWKHVSFYKNSYREFICIGTRTVTEDEISRTYAILLVDGGSYTESQTESQT